MGIQNLILTLAPPSGASLPHVRRMLDARSSKKQQQCMKNSNSLKTENSLTVLPRLLSVSIFGDPVPNKKKRKKNVEIWCRMIGQSVKKSSQIKKPDTL